MLTSHTALQWLDIPITACYRPSPQPRQSCRLPSPCLEGVCSTIPLPQHRMATTLVPLQVSDTGQRGENEVSDAGASAAATSPLRACAMSSCWQAAEEAKRRGSVAQKSPQAPGPALPSSHVFLDVQSAAEMQRAGGSATPRREPSAWRIKTRLFCPG